MTIVHASIIYVLEDNIFFLNYLGKILKKRFPSFQIILFSNAIHMIEDLALRDQLPFLIVADINLKECNGIGLSRNVQMLFNNKVPFIFISSDNKFRSFVEALQFDYRPHFLGKPFTSDELNRTINLLMKVPA